MHILRELGNAVLHNTGNFGNVCVGSFVDEPLIVANSGKCTLTITGIASTSAEFLVPEVLFYPITIGPGNSLPVGWSRRAGRPLSAHGNGSCWHWRKGKEGSGDPDGD